MLVFLCVTVWIVHSRKYLKGVLTYLALSFCGPFSGQWAAGFASVHGCLPGPFLLSYSVFDFIFPYFFVSEPCARLSWPSRHLLSAR